MTTSRQKPIRVYPSTIALDLDVEILKAVIGEAGEHERSLAEEALTLVREGLQRRRRIPYLPDGFPPGRCDED